MQSNRHYFRILLIISDYVLIHLACRLAYWLKFDTLSIDYGYSTFFIIYNLAWIVSSLTHHVYDVDKLFSFRVYAKKFISTGLTHLLIICFYIVSLKAHYFSRFYLLYVYLITGGGMLLFRLVLSLLYQHYQNISYHSRTIVVVGKGKTVNSLYDFFCEQDARVFRFIGSFEDVGGKSTLLVKSQLEELKRFCLKENVDEIYFTLPLHSDMVIDELSVFADEHFIYFRIVTDIELLQNKNVHVDYYGNIPIIQLRKEPLKLLANRLLKRAFDIVFSLLIILILFPIIFPIIGILIKLESKGPVIFKQLRSGRRNREFTCFKFRTMQVNNESDSKQASKGDARLTKIGAFLRKTNLDEFPQFINVLLGDMSVVGPRPHMLKHTEEYSQIVNRYLVRHFITPGITGHAQINGYRGPTEDPKLMAKRVEYDTWYLENWSLSLDIKIIILTVWNMVSGEENAF